MDYKEPVEKEAQKYSGLYDELKVVRKALNFQTHKIGNEYFNSIINYISNLLNTKISFIGQLMNEDNIETVSHFMDGSMQPNFNYNLKDTPCNNVVGREVCIYPHSVAEIFNKDIELAQRSIQGYAGVPLFNSRNEPLGNLVTLFERPIENVDMVKSVLLIFSTQIGAELEHNKIYSKFEQTQAALQKSNRETIKAKKRADHILEGTNAGNWQWNIKTGRITINNRWAELIGYEKNELKPHIQSWIESVHPTDYKITSNKLEAHFRQETNYYDAVFRQKHKDGHWVWINARGKVTHWDRNQKPERMSGIHLDVTNQKIAEEAIKENENQLQLIFDSSPAIMILVNESREILKINKFGLQFIGKKKEETSQKSIGALLNCVNAFNDEKKGCGYNSLCMDCVVRNSLLKSIFSKVSTIKEETKISISRYGKLEERTILVSTSLAKEEPPYAYLLTIDDITEQKIAEHALIESEKRYHSIIESANDAIFIADSHNGLIIDTNKKSEKMLGKSREEILGLHQSSLHPPEEAEEMRKNFVKDVQQEELSTLREVSIQHSSGAKIPVEVSPTKIMGEGGQELVVSFFRDITERIEAKRKLEESHTKYKTLANYTFDWEYWKDELHNFVYVSPSCKRITGYQPEEFMQDASLFKSIIYEDDLVLWNRHEKQSTNRIPCKKPIEFKIRRKDGNVIWISHACQPVYDEKGVFLGNRGTNREITDQKITESKLIESEQKYRLLFENMTSGFALNEMIYDDKGNAVDYKFLEVNPAYELLTGFTSDKLIGNTVRTVMPQTESYWIEAGARVSETGDPQQIENYSGTLDKYYNSYFFSPKKGLFAIVFNDVTERRKAEYELIESENKLKLHLEQTPLGVIEWGPNNEILAWNKAAEEIFGFQLEDFKEQKGMSLIVPADLHEEILKKWNTLLEKGHVKSVNRNITKDGREIICEWNNTTIKDFDQKIIGVISMVQDVTDREKTQEELKISEERHKMISKIASDYVYSFRISEDQKSYLEWVSGAFTRITGYTVEEINLLVNNWRDIIHPNDRDKVTTSFGLGDLPVARAKEYRIVTKHGLIKWISDNYIPLKDDDGVLNGIIGSVSDITDRKVADISLRESEEKLKRLAEITHEGIIIHDGGLVLEINQAVTRITGFSEQELIGLDLRELIHEDYIPLVNNNVEKKDYSSNILKIIKKTGEIISIQVDVRPYLFKGKNVRLASIWDVTQKIETEKSLKKNEEYLNKAQKIAHLGYWHWDIEREELIYSDEIVNIYELNGVEKSLDEVYRKFIHPDDKALIDQIWACLFEGGCKFDEEFRIVTNEKVKWLRVAAELTRNAQQKPASILGVTYDITNRKEAEIKIRAHDLEKFELNNKIANHKMMALRSAMNPHFIFNSLNSIQYFIMGNDKKSAISYLSLFSNLIRNVLNSAVDEYTTLEKEIELLKYYVELENLRFENQFWFNLKIDEDIDTTEIEIPSLLIQPYVENAIIHGLLNKNEAGILKLEIRELKEKLLCIVEDDGVGRARAKNMNTENRGNKRSVGMSITEQRLDIINKSNEVSVKIIDLESNGKSTGTRVEILITIN